MQHLDLLVNLLTLLSGIITAVLGFLLYLKYRINEIKYYAAFILTTTLTVTITTIHSYLANVNILAPNSLGFAAAFVVFEIFIFLINCSFTFFALGIMKKPLASFNKLLLFLPVLGILLSLLSIIYSSSRQGAPILPDTVKYYFMLVLLTLFLSLIIYSVQIGLSLKNIANPDLKRALQVLALLVVVFIPVQTIIINVSGQWITIMLSRNIFYFAVHITSIVFAAKYFFLHTPSIMEQLELQDSFLQKYGITPREKEVMELLLSGLSIKEISGRLDRSFKTVNNHIYNIYRKTNVTSKMELLNLVRENRL